MSRSIFIYVLLSLSACGFPPYEENEPVRFFDVEQDKIDFINEVIDYTNSVAPDEVNLNGYIVQVSYDKKWVEEQCGMSGILGCTYSDYRLIIMMWYDDFPYINATIFSHEMGHVYYDEKDGDSDGEHKHSEWFSLFNENSVVRKVQDFFFEEYNTL